MNLFILQLIEHLRYPGVFAGAFIEGPATALIAGFFIKSGFLRFTTALTVHWLGDFTADMFYFLAGRMGGKKLLKRIRGIFHFSEKEAGDMKRNFKKHHFKIIFTGKLTHFLGLPAIIGIGLSDYSWKKFFIFDLIATAIKSTLLVSLGYGFGTIWKQQESLISRVGAAIFLSAVLLSIYFLFKKRRNEKKV